MCTRRAAKESAAHAPRAHVQQDLQDFIVAASQLHSAEARQAALSQKAREILEAPRPIEKKAALLEVRSIKAGHAHRWLARLC